MGLNDEIGNFSKRREVELSPKKYDEYKEDEYEDWNDEDISFDFKMYSLGELEQFNREAQELDKLILPWWKNLKIIFTKAILSQIGILEYKKKYLLSDETFSGVEIRSVAQSLEAVKVFEERLEQGYWRKIKSNLYSIVFYVLIAYWFGWNFIFSFLVAWSSFDILFRHFKNKKHQKWVKSAKHFIASKNGNNITIESAKETTQLEDVMAFNVFASQQEKEHWSIKLYDAAANIFKRKK